MVCLCHVSYASASSASHTHTPHRAEPTADRHCRVTQARAEAKGLTLKELYQGEKKEMEGLANRRQLEEVDTALSCCCCEGLCAEGSSVVVSRDTALSCRVSTDTAWRRRIFLSGRAAQQRRRGSNGRAAAARRRTPPKPRSRRRSTAGSSPTTARCSRPRPVETSRWWHVPHHPGSRRLFTTQQVTATYSAARLATEARAPRPRRRRRRARRFLGRGGCARRPNSLFLYAPPPRHLSTPSPSRPTTGAPRARRLADARRRRRADRPAGVQVGVGQRGRGRNCVGSTRARRVVRSQARGASRRGIADSGGVGVCCTA